MNRDRHLGLRQRLVRRIATLEAELIESIDAGAERAKPVELDQTVQGRVSRMDAMQQQAMAVAALNRARTRLTELRRARLRLNDEDYGDCQTCGEPIAEARLMANPAQTRCVACAAAAETPKRG